MKVLLFLILKIPMDLEDNVMGFYHNIKYQ